MEVGLDKKIADVREVGLEEVADGGFGARTIVFENDGAVTGTELEPNPGAKRPPGGRVPLSLLATALGGAPPPAERRRLAGYVLSSRGPETRLLETTRRTAASIPPFRTCRLTDFDHTWRLLAAFLISSG